MRIGRSSELQHLVEMAEEMAGVGYWRTDAETRIATWSAQVARIHGIDPDEFDGELTTAASYYHPDDQAIAASLMDAALKDGTPFTLDLRLIRADGELRNVIAKGAAERDASGKVRAVFGTFMDVTEARRAEAALKSSEARHRLFAENATDMIMMSNVEGRLTYISPSVQWVTGYRPDLLVGRAVVDLVHPADAPEMVEASRRLYAGEHEGDAPRLEYRARHRDGRWLWFETRTSLIHDPVTGEATGALDVAREITARKQLEEELVTRTHEAQAANEAKSAFLANMSHEIRTPLTAILGFSRLLRDMDGLPAGAGVHLQRIAKAGEALLTVVNDVLDFSKLDAGLLELDPHPFAPAAFLRETVDLVASQASLKGLSLDVDLDADLPQAVVADSSRLRQILLNLLSNAVKFTQKGGIGIVARHDGEQLHVAVHDTGGGVPAERLDRLFQRFSQVDSSVSREHGGSGLGLAICKRLAELMGGRIGVESASGHGSVFRFTIDAPVGVIDAGLMVDEVAAPGMRAARILLVDDLAVNRELARAILEPFGHDITEAGGGREAVELAHQDTFDLILMDIQMPGMDGLAATRAIRALAEPNHATPILALSADVLAGQLDACWAAGMNGHIAKPIDIADLVAKVAAWTALDDGETGLQSQAG